jgi:hypothetical protein
VHGQAIDNRTHDTSPITAKQENKEQAEPQQQEQRRQQNNLIKYTHIARRCVDGTGRGSLGENYMEAAQLTIFNHAPQCSIVQPDTHDA